MGPEDNKPKLRYRIGDVVLDTATREVERGSQSLKIGGLTFDLFLALTEAAPALLTHDELAARVWPGRVVTPDTLTQRVRMLREALDDDAKSPTYVQLVRGQGYRLIADVTLLQTLSGPAVAATTKPGRPVGFAMLAGLAGIAVLGAVFWSNVAYQPGDAGPTGPTKTPRQRSNVNAFDAYERGVEAFSTPTTDNLRKSIGFLEQAVAADPNFAAAWAELSVAYQRAPSWLITDRDYFSMAKEAAGKALALDDNQPLAHAVLGVGNLETNPVDYAAAMRHLDQALELDPSNATALHWRGIAHTATGFFEKAYEDLTLCQELHPGNGSCRGWISFSRLCAGDTEYAFALFESAAEEGIRTHTGAFAKAFAAEGERSKAILTWAWDFSGSNINADSLYRAHTDPNYDFLEGAETFAAEYAMAHGRTPNWGKPGAIDAAHTFKRYEAIEAIWWYPVWWLRMHKDFLTSEERTELMRGHGLFDYWDIVGPPAHCIADGDGAYTCT